MSPIPVHDDHQPTVMLNTGGGVRTFYGCCCGFTPDPPPTHMHTRASGYHAHRAALGLPYMHSLAGAVFGPGYPGEGQTWGMWHKDNPGIDPFTGEILDNARLLPPRP